MKPTNSIPSHGWRGSAETLTIRMAVPGDAAVLDRLAQLDSARHPERRPMLVAEVGGELCVALPLDGGPAIADPFRRTAELVTMLVERTRQFEAPAAWPASRRWRVLRAMRSAPAPRA